MNKHQVKRLRASLGITQAELARRVGVNHSLVCLWEKGRRAVRGPALIVLRQIAEAMPKQSQSV